MPIFKKDNTLLIFLFVTFMLFLITSSVQKVNAIQESQHFSNLENSNKQQISSDVKKFIIDQIVNKSKSAIVIGFIGTNGTSVYHFGNISESNNRPVNGNTLFNIDSITKTFTTLTLADMVNQGILKLSDPIEKYLPSNVTVPEFNGIKIKI
jgi:CubicO group peptidase (beta-lactamase class C family)